MITTLTEVTAPQLADIMAIWLASNLETHDFVSARYWQENFALVKQLMPQAELTIAQAMGKLLVLRGCRKII